MSDPVVPVSWGELFDKISILEIKQARLSSPEARAAAASQRARLAAEAGRLSPVPASLGELRAGLKAVNEKLWDIEDEIRSHEARKEFNERFVFLAREVYFNNDERGRLKRAIDELLRSEMTEQKEYTPYDRGHRR